MSGVSFTHQVNSLLPGNYSFTGIHSYSLFFKKQQQHEPDKKLLFFFSVVGGPVLCENGPTENPACLWGSTSSTAFFGWLSSPKNPFQQHRDDYLEVCGRSLYFASTNHRSHAVSPLLLDTFIASPGSWSFFSIAFLGVQKLPHNLWTRMRQIPQ